MKYNQNLTEEEKVAVKLGFLPTIGSILTIISNTNYYAVVGVKTEDDEEGEVTEIYSMLVAWAYLKNGTCMPLVYDAEFHTLRNPEVLENFIRVSDEPDDDDEEGILDDSE